MFTLLKWTHALLNKVLELGQFLFFVPFSDTPAFRDLISFFDGTRFADILYNIMDAPLAAFILLDGLSLILLWKLFKFFLKII